MWEEKKVGAHGARWILFCFLVLAIAACKSNDTEEEQPVVLREFPGVDERLWPFFRRFEDEAATRGITIDLVRAGITGVIEEIDRENVAGSCNFSATSPNHVMVDLQFWNSVGDLFREFIVFHELGHCSLFRDHREATDAQGFCLSIMRSGTGDCQNNYRSFTRDRHLDELYDPTFARDIFNN